MTTESGVEAVDEEGPGADELPGRRLRGAPAPSTPAQRRKLIDTLLEHGFDEAAAEAVARSVEDPKSLVEQLKAPAEFGVHGGTIRYVTTRVLNGTVLPIPTNPRVAGEVHYAAGGAAQGGIEALQVEGMVDDAPGLVIKAQSAERLRADMTTAADYVRSHNKLRDSVASQGVLLPVTLVPTCFTFDEGGGDRVILCTIDGSSRLTASMDIWGLSPSEVLFDLADPATLRGRLDTVRDLLEVDETTLTTQDREVLRTRTLPAQLIVGWEAEESELTFPEILDAYLGLLHVEPPTPWGEAAGQDSRAEVVLDELERSGRISSDKRLYLAGHLMPDQATALGFDPSLDGRSAAIFYELDRRKNTNRVNRALRRIGMRNIDRADRLAVATELAMRPYRRRVPDLNRRNPRQALPAAMGGLRPDESGWQASTSEVDELIAAALQELSSGGTASAARAELGARGAFWLTRYSCLQKSSRTDPRLANEVLKEVLSKDHGLYCLSQAIKDGRAGKVPRQVREDGSILTTVNGEPPQTDKWLRETFPPQAPAPSPEGSDDDQEGPDAVEVTPQDELREKIYSLREFTETLALRVDDLTSVKDDDENPLVDRVGVSQELVAEMASDLDRVRTRLLVLGSIWERTSDVSAG